MGNNALLERGKILTQLTAIALTKGNGCFVIHETFLFCYFFIFHRHTNSLTKLNGGFQFAVNTQLFFNHHKYFFGIASSGFPLCFPNGISIRPPLPYKRSIA